MVYSTRTHFVCHACILFFYNLCARFSLVQLRGAQVLFTSEEKNDTWCGAENRSCVDCTNDIAGRERDTKCADRLMTPSLAEKISKLSRYVRAVWPRSQYFFFKSILEKLYLLLIKMSLSCNHLFFGLFTHMMLNDISLPIKINSSASSTQDMVETCYI